jgi:hypothetical protein
VIEHPEFDRLRSLPDLVAPLIANIHNDLTEIYTDFSDTLCQRAFMALQNCSCDGTSFGVEREPRISLFPFSTGNILGKWPI